MIMASRVRVNFPSYLAGCPTGAAGAGRASRPRTPVATAENRQEVGATRDVTFSNASRLLARSPVEGTSSAALRGPEWMNAVRSRGACPLEAEENPHDLEKGSLSEPLHVYTRTRLRNW